MANSTSGESVIRRVAKILGAFDGSHTALSVAAMARRADLPQTTTYRMVDELVLEGLLQRDPNGLIQIGNRLWAQVSRSSPMLGLREAAMPFMEDVQAVVGHHTALGVLEGDEVLYIERLGSRTSTINIAEVARRLPLHGASSGMVLLAHAPAEFQERVLSRRLTKFTSQTVVDPAVLRRQLADIRQQGYAVRSGIIIAPSSGIAVPIFGVDDKVVATLSVIVPINEENAAARVPVLRAAARGISRALGWPGREPEHVRQSIPRG
jgi:DNA-binding IclR family transcriptional regulator